MEQHTKEKLTTTWQGLLIDLNKEAGKDIYVLENNISSGISNFIRRQDKNKNYCQIYRDPIYRRDSFYHSGRYALRIKTNNYGIKATGLGKDFGAKNLAKGLHKKCNELLEKIDTKEKAKAEKQQKEFDLEFAIKKAFPEAENIEQVYNHSYRGKYTPSRQKKFDYNKMGLTTYDSKTFGVTLRQNLTPSQVKKLVKFLDTL